ncbi:MAG: hypothetical protein DWQ04_34885, partial [Chloroflexi bacterium]
KIEDKKRNISLVAEVAQHIGNDTARCVALAPTDGMVRGIEFPQRSPPILTTATFYICQLSTNNT